MISYVNLLFDRIDIWKEGYKIVFEVTFRVPFISADKLRVLFIEYLGYIFKMIAAQLLR